VAAAVDLAELVFGAGEADFQAFGSPSQPSRSASAMRVRRLSRISAMRVRCAGSGQCVMSTTAARGAAPQRAVRPKTAAEKAFCALGPVAGRSSPALLPQAASSQLQQND